MSYSQIVSKRTGSLKESYEGLAATHRHAATAPYVYDFILPQTKLTYGCTDLYINNKCVRIQ
jgi:hypothetical protein